MSRRVIDRSPDLSRLRQDGYEIQVHPSRHLLVNNVPYVTDAKTVAYGTLIVKIVQLLDDKVGAPENHQAYFRGQFPCSNEGVPLTVMGQPAAAQYRLSADLEAQYYFSYKSSKFHENSRYIDYYDLVTSYVGEMLKYAKRVGGESVTALTGRAFDFDEPASIFAYPDTASTRVGITDVTEKLAGHKIAIIGLGGTGSYVLDFVAKTPVEQIHLYDGDLFVQHNAFRSPGAASLGDVAAVPPLRKVDYFKQKYGVLHLGIISHPEFVREITSEFAAYDFIFVCVDKATAKRAIVEGLIKLGKPFIDVGMGVTLEERSLGGLLRTTFSSDERRDHRHGIRFVDVEDEYATNIQIADLNALNAALAVVRWKKSLGFYRSTNLEFSSIYTIDFNRIDNGDQLGA